MNESSAVILEEDNEQKCHFCGYGNIHEWADTWCGMDFVTLGQLYLLKGVVAHYYCLLLSHGMKQNGEDNEGIQGFLLNDIKAELKRASKIKCKYCLRLNASLQCSHEKCDKKFHLPCGLRLGSMSQFMKPYLSFCSVHRPRQEIPEAVLTEAENNAPICPICLETGEVKIIFINDALWAPCCSKTWYHKLCLQQLANSFGIFTKCVNCNESNEFTNCMQKFGIFIPEQDASWELEPNAFKDWLFRYNKCDADDCKCPKGQTYHLENTEWEIKLCMWCASHGRHIACVGEEWKLKPWECSDCKIGSNSVVEPLLPVASTSCGFEGDSEGDSSIYGEEVMLDERNGDDGGEEEVMSESEIEEERAGVGHDEKELENADKDEELEYIEEEKLGKGKKAV